MFYVKISSVVVLHELSIIIVVIIIFALYMYISHYAIKHMVAYFCKLWQLGFQFQHCKTSFDLSMVFAFILWISFAVINYLTVNNSRTLITVHIKSR